MNTLSIILQIINVVEHGPDGNITPGPQSPRRVLADELRRTFLSGINIKEPSVPKKFNLWICEKCRSPQIGFETVNNGVTPFMTPCLQAGCRGMAQSCFYRVPVVEWYRPTEKELEDYISTFPAKYKEKRGVEPQQHIIDGAAAETRKHVANGGLLSRPWEPK